LPMAALDRKVSDHATPDTLFSLISTALTVLVPLL